MRENVEDTDKIDNSHEGEGSILLGLLQLIVVIAFIAGSFLVSGLLGANKKPLGQKNGEDRVMVAEVMQISPAPYHIAFETTGIVQARAEISVTPQVSGKVVKVNPAFFQGGKFEKDDVLFEIEPKDFELEIQRLKAQVAQAQTAFNIEQAEAEAASLEWAQINGATPVPALVARKPQKAEAWANLKAAKAQLETAALSLERTKVSMPFAGRVLSSSIEQGQFVTAGQSYGQVYDATTLEVQASLEDRELRWLFDAQSPNVDIIVNQAGESKQYKGILNRGVSSLDTATRFASIRFGFEMPPEDLLPGVFATLKIKGPVLQKVLRIPARAIQKDGTIWHVDSSQSLQRLSADEVFSNADYTIIRGRDLNDIGDGLKIVTGRMPGAIEGMEIDAVQTQNGDE